MTVKTISGKVFTDDELDEMAKEYEEGTWKGPLGKIRTGRPSIADEEVKAVVFRLPISKIAALDAQASALGETRSQFLRNAVDAALQSGS
ncbi:MAG: toxin-antitoxin system antitoxin subunit [Coriobacteriia bacterium]|nr:toxin-antitoxin system antitoxin subunit [Coriobacteriia bacterium]